MFSFNKYENDLKQKPFLNMENMQKLRQDKQIFEQVAGESSGFTLKHTADLVKKILKAKLAYNQKCLDHNMPMLTGKQYLYIFFAESYSMRNLISENIELLMMALSKYKDEKAEVLLGYYIFNNLCDENFFLVFQGLCTTMKEFFRGYIKELFAAESEGLRNKVLKKKMNGSSKLSKKEVKFLVSEMVSKDRSKMLELAAEVDTYRGLEKVLMTHFVGRWTVNRQRATSSIWRISGSCFSRWTRGTRG